MHIYININTEWVCVCKNKIYLQLHAQTWCCPIVKRGDKA